MKFPVIVLALSTSASAFVSKAPLPVAKSSANTADVPAVNFRRAALHAGKSMVIGREQGSESILQRVA